MHAALSADVMISFNNVQTQLRIVVDQMSFSLKEAKAAQSQLTRLPRTTEENELKTDLRSPIEELQKARQQLRELESEGRLGRLIKGFSARKLVATAEQVLADQKGKASGPNESARRKEQVAAHNRQVEDVARQFQELSQKMERAKAWLIAGKKLQEQLHPLEQALLRQGWVNGDSAALLDEIQQHLTRSDISAALQVAGNLLFQTMPTTVQIEKWIEETVRLRTVACSEGGVGFTALGSFTSVVSGSTELMLASCTRPVQQAVHEDLEPADRWYHLAHQLTRPEHVMHWVQWALYWAGFQTAQRFSKELSLADAHEEHSTGAFLSSFRAELERWAGPKIDSMGFPKVTSFMGTLALGGTTAEAHLGADFGIIVDVNVGGLVVRKVALVQGKVSKNGKADIGSKPSGPHKLTQLEKLNDPQRDFYAFYHCGLRQASVPWPTVDRACALVKPDTDVQAGSIIVSTRENGWDWASFFAFGLCSESSGVGRMLEEHEDALAVLGGEHRELLPSRLIVVAAGGSDYSFELQRRVQQHYSTIGTGYKRAMDKRDGPKMQGPGWGR
ncbi:MULTISPECIES: hypothetical protein [unclassified Pseudomonas]|uniref:hypothetical protein n=1 Tax=unclassified Pseudomonas TaxID=196821 RepID=UPI0015870E03|nr:MULTISPECIES: hypothetical protein [unclassified Pseudomonas]QKV63930.1 hypothetical protein HUW52_13880 [Pseudomonas sp. 43A]QMW07929.1 hypothetical protein H3303_18815 [Pseudomonas sp. 29A]